MHRLGRRAFTFSSLAALGCRPKGAVRDGHANAEPRARGDAHSVARPREVRVVHTGLDLHVAMASRVITGVATFRVERFDPLAPLHLDTRALEIDAVEIGRSDRGTPGPLARVHPAQGFAAADWSRLKYDEILGTGLRVELPGEVDLVRIKWRTTVDSTALQWLDPAQTADARPFLYTQSQAIHGRSWMPCQDTPSVRSTFDAVVAVDEPLVALMGARRLSSDGGEFRFEMPEPIPSYLVALAVGRLEFQATGDRSGVWAEPSVVQRAAHELADVERMMVAAERLFGPYRWERYDVLFLPPAFPFGGMENPRLTFCTPTILAGDRSLVALVAHELAHSWSGNLVTNASWDHVWLNEGFTVYIERRIMEELFGRDRYEMEASLGWQDLQQELAVVDDPDERLRVDLRGRDPDVGLSDVAYEKGALLLVRLEQAYGREVFDPWLRAWFFEHAFTSVTTDDCERFLHDNLLAVAQPRPGQSKPDLAAWIDAPGLPADAPQPDPAPWRAVDESVRAYLGPSHDLTLLDAAQWGPHEWLHFLRALPSDLPPENLRALDERHGLSGSSNYEILARWLELSVQAGYRGADDRLERFLATVGRRKFLEPLYRALLAAGRKDDAVRIYAAARPGYHAITQRTIDEILGLGA